MFKDNIFTGTFQDYSVWFLIFFAIYFSEKQANGGLSKDFLLPVIIFVVPVLISFLLWFLLWLGKKEKCSFSRKKIISSLMLMLYTVKVVLSVSLGMIIEYHTIVEYIYPWKMFSSIHFYFYIYCKHGQRRKYGALQTLATMAELLLSC